MEQTLIYENYDVAVIGGGIAGMCAAIAAARHGANTVLVHDRPVLGGNASSEIRMHICGADNHMNRPNARETGILEEILLAHKQRNPENSWPIFDSILWEKCAFQPNLTLHLNTHMTDVETEQDRITTVYAAQLTTEKKLAITAGIFIDATGDGTLSEKSGAEYIIGRESKDTYGESHAPDQSDHYTMGSSLMFSARDMGHPVPFVKPFWANTYTEQDMLYRDHSVVTSGYWWIELGGGEERIIEENEALRDELLKSVFGVWDHIKNGGDHGAENMELDWVGFLPGKRESRRVLGDYVLTEQDCLAATPFEDTVAYGGWPMDIHVIEGFRNPSKEPTIYLHMDDVFSIPYRSLYSRNVSNLMLAGRIISASHIAFASTRVMGTCAVAAQAAGTAAALATHTNITPREVSKHMAALQQALLRDDCFLPHHKNTDPLDLARTATVSASCNDSLAENIINGVARTVHDDKNFWQGEQPSGDWISLDFKEAVSLQQVQITLDSNLSQEIMISLSDWALARQEMNPPSTLVKTYQLDFYKEGTLVKTLAQHENYNRLNRIDFESPILCDRITLTILATHGTDQPKVFELRAYQ